MNMNDLNNCINFPKSETKSLMMICISGLMERLDIENGWDLLESKWGNSDYWNKELTHKILVTIYNRLKNSKY